MIIATAALVLALGAPAIAAPGLDWRTVHSQCCDVHFPAQLEHVARRVATIADASVANASVFLQSKHDERVQIVIHDVTDSPNGFTNVVPYDDVDLRTITPESDSELAVTDEYLKLLVQHEILHVVHLDTYSGLPAIVNIVVGKVWPPNLIQPRFVVEGLAVFAETRFTNGGRLRSTLFSTDLLIAALHNDLWSLDDVSNYSRRNPGGGAAYAYGAEFVDWLSRKYGPDIWSKIAADYGGDPVPFAVQRSIENATGHDVERDYAAFLDDIRAEANALKRACDARGGPTKARRLTRFGGTLHGARFDVDGTLYAPVDSPDQVPTLIALRGLPDAVPKPESIARLTEAGDVVVVPAANASGPSTIVVAQTEVSRGWWQFHDLWRVDRKTGTLDRITREARVRACSLIPGTRDVVCEQRSAKDAALVVVDVDTGAVRDLVRADDGSLWYTPDVSADGEHVVASKWSPGGARQIVEIDVVTGIERVLTDDGDQDLDPSYVDDAWVLFSSDREGLFSVYAVNRETREVRRVVDSLGLAKFPRATPDKRGVVYVDTDLDGNDLYAAALDIAHAPVVDKHRTPPLLGAFTDEASPIKAPTERYNALPTLLPHYYVPIVATDATGAPAVGVAVVGQDTVGQLSFSAQGTWDFGLGRPHLAATVRDNDLWTPVDVNGELRTDRSNAIRRSDGHPDFQQETVLSAGAAITIPFARAFRFDHSLSIGYQREFHVVETGVTSPPDARTPPVYPPNANVGAITVDWSYAGIDAYRDSISNEQGFTSFLHLRHADRWFTFSTQDITEATVDARWFVPVPGLGAHVVGVYLSGGYAIGNPLLRDSFFLGGFADRDITKDLLNGTRSGAGVLRGYDQGALQGDGFALGTIEYRFPLLELERGFSTLPIYFDRVHGAVFTDLGDAFTGAPDARAFKASVGVELRAQITLAYYGLFLIRAGYARGVSRGGVDQPYVVLGFPY